MTTEEKVTIENDEPVKGEESEAGVRSETLRINTEELIETVKKLVREATVRKIVVKTSEGRTLIEIPLGLGVAGLTLLPFYSSLALIAALLTECTILVERRESKSAAASAESD